MTQQLIDTHTLLWLIHDDPRLSAIANEVINDTAIDAESKLFVSVISLWEIAIKTNIRKLDLRMSLKDFVAKQQKQYSIRILPVETAHLFVASTLPFPLSNHKDPFDRLIISQCLALSIPIISSDEKFDAYGIQRIW